MFQIICAVEMHTNNWQHCKIFSILTRLKKLRLLNTSKVRSFLKDLKELKFFWFVYINIFCTFHHAHQERIGRNAWPHGIIWGKIIRSKGYQFWPLCTPMLKGENFLGDMPPIPSVAPPLHRSLCLVLSSVDSTCMQCTVVLLQLAWWQFFMVLCPCTCYLLAAFDLLAATSSFVMAQCLTCFKWDFFACTPRSTSSILYSYVTLQIACIILYNVYNVFWPCLTRTLAKYYPSLLVGLRAKIASVLNTWFKFPFQRYDIPQIVGMRFQHSENQRSFVEYTNIKGVKGLSLFRLRYRSVYRPTIVMYVTNPLLAQSFINLCLISTELTFCVQTTSVKFCSGSVSRFQCWNFIRFAIILTK